MLVKQDCQLPRVPKSVELPHIAAVFSNSISSGRQVVLKSQLSCLHVVPTVSKYSYDELMVLFLLYRLQITTGQPEGVLSGQPAR